jgi:DnaJ-class molecular chaperone
MRHLQTVFQIAVVICLLGLAGCIFDDDFDDVVQARREARENNSYVDNPNHAGGRQDRDWCMTCGGSGSVHYVTTGQTEVCPTCHGTGVR